MLQFAALIRRILLALTYIFSLLLFLLGETTAGPIPLFNLFVVCGVGYIAVSAVSILIRQIRRRKLDEDEGWMDSVEGVLKYNANGSLIHSLRRISFWGSLSFLINFIIIRKKGGQLFGGTITNDSLLIMYSRFLVWSLISFLTLFLISILFWAVYMPHVSGYSDNVFQHIGKLMTMDLKTPIRIVNKLINIRESESRLKDLLSLIIMLLFILFNAICLMRIL